MSTVQEQARYAFACQPVLNGAGASVAVELLYSDRPLTDAARPDNDAEAAANAILSAFVHDSNLDQLLRQRRAFLFVTRALLESELLNLLPSDRFALEVDRETVLALTDRCRALRAKGYRFVLDLSCEADPSRLTDLSTVLPLVDVVKFHAKQAPSCSALIDEAWGQGAQLYASGVDAPEDYAALQQQGFHLFQGYHFAHPLVVEGQRADPQKLAVLDLLAKLTADADDRALEESFKTDPLLSVHLLRLVNSSAFALPTPIRSLKHACAILGREQLRRWLQVLLYVLHGDGKSSPLMELALRRARFMEFVLTYRTHQATSLLQDEAYMVGLMSLADVLMGWNMEQVVERLHLADELRSALVFRDKPLGQLITLCEALEAGEFNRVEEMAEVLQISIEGVMTAQQEAISWALRVANGANASNEKPADTDGAEGGAEGGDAPPEQE
jgi:EAL and modified HD-GYP domain-containing signal transduction protein